MPLQSKLGLNRLDGSSHNPHINNSLMSQSRNNVFVTPTRSTFRRYALAETCLIPSPPRQQKKVNQNIHLSTKIDSRSPGFSSRVVQYNEEQEKSLPTHQAKYDKLGVFPIVHFFKKDLPVLKRKAADFNTSPVSSPDLSKYNTPEQNRILLEKIMKTSPQSQSILSPKSEPNAKSVLDALKEISRKRIHANGEDFIRKDEGKRMIGEYDNENLARKRMKQNTSGDDCIAVSSSSKYSSVDELMASHSSMDGYFPKKTKTDTVTPESTPVKKPAVKSKPVATPTKYVSVETQTIPTSLPTPTQTILETVKPPEQETSLKPIETVTKPKKHSPVKVFDETPLEAMRRNRLTVLMGTSTPIKSKNQNDLHGSGDKLLHKPLVSILSGGSKTPQKSNKHVTFDIPVSTVQNVTSTSSESLASVALTSSIETPSITRTSSSVILPIVSASAVESKLTQKSTLEVKEPPIAVSSNSDGLFMVQPTSSLQFSTSLPIPPPLNFSSPASTTQATVFTSSMAATSTKLEEKPVITTMTSGEGGTTNFIFSSSFNKPSTPTTSSNNLNQQEKAGFKFDLKETSTVAPTVSSSTFSFMGTTTSAKTTATSSSLMFASNTTLGTPAKPTFSFGSPASNNPPAGTGTLTSTPSSKPFSLSSGGPFSHNTNQNGNLAVNSTTSVFSGAGVSVSPSNTFAQSSVVPQTTSSIMPSFGGNIATPSFATTSVNSSKPMFSFGASNNLTATVAPTFGSTIVSPGDGPKPFSLGTTTTTVSSAPISFGAPVNTTAATPSFNTPNNSFASNSSAFSAATTKALTSGGGSFFFGATNSSFNKTSGFNDSNNASTFRKHGASKSMFGQNATPAFGATAAPTFGATTSAASFGSNTTTPTFNTTTAPPTFGTKAAPTFGASSPSFGATTTPSFGGATTTTTATPSFGATATPNFGTTAPSFGSSSNNNNNNNHPSSGGSAFANVSAPSNNMFGGSGGFGSSGTVGTVPTFGSNTTSNFGTSSFGSNEKSGFNTNVNAESKNSFTPAFGSSSFNTGFGVTTTTSGFGTNTNTFTTPTANFGSNGGAFGQPTNNPSFGASSPFDKTAATASNPEPNPFGGNNASFGSSGFSASNPQPNQSGIFAFGSNTSNKPPVFSFGASEPPKPTFNFQTANTNTPNMFASTNPPSFGSVQSAQFNVPPPGGSMFNIGTGGSSNTTRSRTLHKAKRR